MPKLSSSVLDAFAACAGMSRVLKLSSSVVEALAVCRHVRSAQVEIKCIWCPLWDQVEI